MNAQLAGILEAASDQQKDNLCGPFWAARILNDAGFKKWDGEPITEDLVALRAGTLLPEPHDGLDVPPGASTHVSYRHSLPTAPVEQSGTSASGLAGAIEAASDGRLRCVPLSGEWNIRRVERLVDEAAGLGSRLLANVRTGRMWASRPPVEILLAELEGRSVVEPEADWDVGHFVELEMLIRGPRGSLVVVHDSYPSLGWQGRHLQPPHALAAALERGDGREGGVLVIVPKVAVEAARALAAEIGLEVRFWNNGTGS
ncbi:MAG TPA: hypothetical protein VNZ01_12100 [Solirubrobacteraceae bacterium]|nr:hypothetical protein [Solirubrobacteraceae bacterium]